MCSPLVKIAYGAVTWTSLTPYSVATYSCVEGYELVGESTRTCSSSGIWSGKEPVCKPGNRTILKIN